jgi:predicted MFS family arabinose efflux permease
MSLVFSIKQTGVPVGGAIAGVVAPPLALALGWAGALPVLAAACVACAVLLLPARAALAEPRTAVAGPGGLRGALASLGRPIRVALSSAGLREMSFASFGYAAVQLVFITYFVSYLALGLGYTLVAAGLVYASAHGAGIVGRIAWGAVADRWLSPRLTLALLGAISAACALLAAAFSPDWPLAAVVAVGMLFGASAVGWNGVFLAEVARVAPAGQVTTATGGTQFFTFAGALSGPPLFAAAVWATGSYAWAFGLFALPSAAVALRLLARR